MNLPVVICLFANLFYGASALALDIPIKAAKAVSGFTPTIDPPRLSTAIDRVPRLASGAFFVFDGAIASYVDAKGAVRSVTCPAELTKSPLLEAAEFESRRYWKPDALILIEWSQWLIDF